MPLEADSPFRRAIGTIKWRISRRVNREALRLMPSLSHKWSVDTHVLGRRQAEGRRYPPFQRLIGTSPRGAGPPRVDRQPRALQICKSPVPWGLGKQFRSSHSRHVLESGECSHFVCTTHLQLMQVIRGDIHSDKRKRICNPESAFVRFEGIGVQEWAFLCGCVKLLAWDFSFKSFRPE